MRVGVLRVARSLVAGPDICGYSTKKVHVIFTYNDKNLLTKKDIKCKVEISRLLPDTAVIGPGFALVLSFFLSVCLSVILC
jgi:hypothetical protein